MNIYIYELCIPQGGHARSSRNVVKHYVMQTTAIFSMVSETGGRRRAHWVSGDSRDGGGGRRGGLERGK